MNGNGMAKKGKSFWERPQANLAYLLIGLFTFFVFVYFGPVIVLALQNTLHAMILFGSILALVLVFSNKRVRLLISFIFKSVVNKMYAVYRETDPIGILKIYIQSLEKKMLEFEEQLKTVYAHLSRTESQLAKAMGEREQFLKELKFVANKIETDGKSPALVGQQRTLASQIERRNKNISAFTKLVEKLKGLTKILKVYKENSHYLLIDLKDEVEQTEIRYESINAGHKAMGIAMSIINGGGDEYQIYEDTMNYLTTDYEMKVGEITYFFETSENFLTTIDLNNEQAIENAMKELEEFENKTDSILLNKSDSKTTIGDKIKVLTDEEIDAKFSLSPDKLRENLNKLKNDPDSYF